MKSLDRHIDLLRRDSWEIDKKIQEKNYEIERLNNIITNMEEELMTIYVDFMEYNEDYAKREIKKLKDVKK